MPAYSFSLPQFEKMIPEGVKVRTTRVLKDGKRYEQAKRAMANNQLVQLYWKQRTKDCRLLLEAPLVEAEVVIIYADSRVKMHGQFLSESERESYAKEEGFISDANFSAWTYFFGALIALHGPEFWKYPLYTVKWNPKVNH